MSRCFHIKFSDIHCYPHIGAGPPFQFRVIRKNASARHCFCSYMASRHIDFQKYVHPCKHDSQCFPIYTDARIAPCCALPQSVRYSDIAEHMLRCYPHIGAGPPFQFRVIRKNASARHCFCSYMASRHIDFHKYVRSCKHDSHIY